MGQTETPLREVGFRLSVFYEGYALLDAILRVIWLAIIFQSL